MNVMGWANERRGALAGAAIVAAASVTLAGFAVAYDGNPSAEVELDAGSVWVTKTSSEVMGHLNASSALLDGQLRGITNDRVDIMQRGDDAVIFDHGDDKLARANGASMVLDGHVQLPAGSAVDRGGDTVAVLAGDTGGLHVMPVGDLSAFDAEESEPVVEVGTSAVVTVGTDGTVYAFAPGNGLLTTIETGSSGATSGEPDQRRLEGVSDGDVQITSVGSTAILLDEASGTVHSSGGLTTAVGEDGTARLAEDAEAGTAVRVATESSLITVPLDGSEPQRTSNGGSAGAPVQPVVVDGCTYAAWQGSHQIRRDCAGAANDVAQSVEGASDDGLVFRTNGSEVVLNDASAGTSWLASDEMQVIDNWDDLTPPEGDGQDSDEVTHTDEAEIQPPERTAENTPPVAEDDEYGARAGRSSMLPVLDNDSDEDGDVLTITVDDQPDNGRVQVVQDGQALQLTMPEESDGSTASFRYTVDDGRGGTDSARVDIDVRDADENAAPEQKELRPTVAVETGGSVTYNVLPDWIDPDGDNVYLANVVPAEGDEVDFTADGRITYRSLSPYQGPLEVDVTVSDGTDSTTGTLSLDVRPVGTVRPVTNADHVAFYAGDTATVEPLLNDVNAASDDLVLSQVSETAGVSPRLDAQGDAFTITGETPGTYYLDYTASAGAQAAAGLVRVDVLEREDGSAGDPVAVRDIAYLPGGGEVLIDVLQNDHDPAAGVLVVQSVETPGGAGVSAAVLGQSTVQLTDTAMLGEQVVVNYRIHNGERAANGEIVVVPVPATDKVRPPIAADDTATVRAGDIVTVPVTANDSHPNGDTFSVAPEFIERPDEGVGEMFVSQDEVRFRAAPDAQGQVSAVYGIVDSKGQRDAASLTINVTPWNEESNSAPVPEAVTARAIAGAQARVEIPLERIDPDGDSVELVGISSAPQKGRVTETGAGYLTYEADRGASGVDSFEYRVVDTFGAESIGTARVGIAPPPEVNQAPHAMSDEIAMRTGRTVSVPVLANDADPEGDQIGLVPDSVEVLGGELTAVTSEDRVIVTAPDAEGSGQLQYTIEDEKGNAAQGVVQVTVADDVPLEKPIARDDRVLIDDVTSDFTADIALLGNDEDPDGTVDELELDISGVEQLSGEGPGTVRVALEDRRRVIPYTITDVDGGEASAFLIVPAKDDLRPVLKEGAEIVVQSDTLVEISLADYVQVAEGREPRVVSADSVSVKHGNGDALVKDPQTLQYRSVYRYEGTDDITFEVTDGDGPDDPTGRRSVLTIPITVTEPRNEAPEFTNTSTTVGAGDGPVTLDLAQRTYDIDEDELSFSLADPGAISEGVTAQLDGPSLTVEAGPDSRGDDTTIDVMVDDGEADPVVGQVHVAVAASSRPLPAANDDELGEVHQGEPVVVPVLENDTNPFEEEGPLTIVDAEVESGSADIQVDEGAVTLTPGDDFHGYVTARYTIGDVTEDPDRYVQGSITATVLGVPDEPGTPNATKIGNRTATLTWTAPSNNGAEITEYVVKDTLGSDYQKTCTATVCKLGGLVNDREYQFQVAAINEVGSSSVSDRSRVVRPDVKPEAPAAPTYTLEPGARDQRLGVSWNTPENEGSAITGYLVRVDDGTKVTLHEFDGSTATQRTFDGLTNGTRYRFQVAATNRADVRNSSEWAWSPWSAYEKPATVPDAPQAPAIERTDQPYGENEFRLTWKPGKSNGGDGISQWAIRVHQGGEIVRNLDVANDGPSHTVVLPNSAADYRFSVAAVNREGRGEFSDKSAAIRSYSPPGPVTGVAAKPLDEAIEARWNQADPNGVRQAEVRYQYRANGGEWRALPNGFDVADGKAKATIPASNGTSTAISIRAVTSVEGEGTRTGEPGTADPVTPYGEPFAPQIFKAPDMTHAKNVGVDVTTSHNGRNIRRILLEVTGGPGGKITREWTKDGGAPSPGISERFGRLFEPGQKLQVKATIWDTEGQQTSSSIEIRVPRPSFTLTHEDEDTTSDEGSTFTLSWEHLAPPDTGYGGFTYRCQQKDPDSGEWERDGFGREWFGYQNSSGTGRVEIDCFGDKVKPGEYRIRLEGGFPQVPDNARNSNSVTVERDLETDDSRN